MKHSLKASGHIHIGGRYHKHRTGHVAQGLKTVDRGVGTRLNPHHRGLALSGISQSAHIEERIGALHGFVIIGGHDVAIAVGHIHALGHEIEIGA